MTSCTIFLTHYSADSFRQYHKLVAALFLHIKSQSSNLLTSLIFCILLNTGRDCWSHFCSTVQHCAASGRSNDCGSM